MAAGKYETEMKSLTSYFFGWRLGQLCDQLEAENLALKEKVITLEQQVKTLDQTVAKCCGAAPLAPTETDPKTTDATRKKGHK